MFKIKKVLKKEKKKEKKTRPTVNGFIMAITCRLSAILPIGSCETNL